MANGNLCNKHEKGSPHSAKCVLQALSRLIIAAALVPEYSSRDRLSCIQVACLGVTESGWQIFAEAAVQALRLDHAAAAYERMHDPRKLHAVQRLNRQISEGLSLPLACAAALSLLVSPPPPEKDIEPTPKGAGC